MDYVKRRLCLPLLFLVWAAPAFAAEDDFLPPEEAFRYEVSASANDLEVRWTVAPGYYAYRSRMGIESATPGVTVGPPVYPKGEIHRDDYFGEQEIFRGAFTVKAPLTRSASAPDQAGIKLKIQGCADAGLCYPPLTWDASVKLPPQSASSGGRMGIDAIFGAARAQSSAGDFLHPDVAFRLEATAEGPDRVRLLWQIADGYYLYRSKTTVKTPSAEVQLGQLSMPQGKSKTDDYFGTQEVYYNELSAALPVSRAAGSSLELPLEVTYQGCADAGLCYPPITKTLSVTLPPGQGSGGGYVSSQDRFSSLIVSGNVLIMLATFFGAGLLLAFTPCVLPMVPILSGIIAGQGSGVTTRRAFALSLTYVLGMAFTYTLAGALFAAAGKQAQAVFQQPWIITLFAALFVALALSMFGAFTLQMPVSIQTRLSNLSNRQSGGTFGGVAAMGALSALIVTTCVGPALVGALAVISESGNVVRGSAALFAMSIGMGTPLLVVGASAGKLMPKTGPWMDTVKKLVGVMMLAVAAWMLERIVPESASLLLWAVPVLAAAWVFWSLVPRRPSSLVLARAVSVIAAVYGLALVAGAAMGGTHPLSPIPAFAGERHELGFRRIKSVADLEREVGQASAAGRPVMVDFYADWCVSCKEMERYTFTDGAVQQALSGTVLLQADVTANDDQDQALLRHFGIFGPPTIAFYDATGREQRQYRVVGFMKAPEFEAVVRQAIGDSAT